MELPVATPVMPSSPPSTTVLFCPFCRESFEGEALCPEHELRLVPFAALPREHDAEALPALDERVGAFDPRFGRGWLVAGVAALVLGFAAPVPTLASAAQTRAFSGFEAATSRAPNLWTIPFVAGMFVWFLARRRTPVAMLGARLAALVFSLAPLTSAVYTVLKVRHGASQMLARGGAPLEVRPEIGLVLLALGTALLFVGSLRFGVLPSRDGATRRRLRPS